MVKIQWETVETAKTENNLPKAKGVKSWQKGESYTGYFVETKEVPKTGGKIHRFEDMDDDTGGSSGTFSEFWNGDQFDKCVAVAAASPDRPARFTFLGSKPTASGRTVYDFTVQLGTVNVNTSPKKAPLKTKKEEPKVLEETLDDFDVDWKE